LAQARKILARSKAIKSIATVTRTMEMVATARFKRAYNRCVSARKYIDGVGELLGQVVARAGVDALDKALLARNQASPQVVIVITSDRGLCSGYNLALLKLTTDRLKELQASGTDIKLHVAGKKGILHLQKAVVPLAETYSSWAGGMPSWRWTSRCRCYRYRRTPWTPSRKRAKLARKQSSLLGGNLASMSSSHQRRFCWPGLFQLRLGCGYISVLWKRR